MISNISSKYGINKDKKKEEEEKKSGQSNSIISGAQIALNVLKQFQDSIGNSNSSSTNKTTQAQTAKTSAPAQSAGTQTQKPKAKTSAPAQSAGTQKPKASLWNSKNFMDLDDAVRAAYVYNSIAYGSGKASDSKMMEAINNSNDRTIRSMRTPEGVMLTPAQAYKNLDNAAKSRWLSSGENNAVPSLLSQQYARKEINANWNKDWLTLAEERKEAEKQKKQADDYMDQFDAPIQEARSGITNQLQLQNNTVAPFDERPDDYNDYADNYDRILYDWGVGEKGAYEKIGRIGSREEILARNEKIKELWGDIDNESNRRYNEARRNRQEHQAEYDIAKSQSEYYNSQLEAIGNRERQRDEYFGLIDQYDDDLTRTDYVPEYDRGHDNAYGSLGELDRGVVTDDVDRIYSLIGGGKEWKSWNSTGKNQISPEYSYAMLMTDGSNGSFNEKGIFMNLYNQAMKEGREPVEAKAFLEGLQPALRARYSGYESVRLQEAARQMPILTSAASLAMGLTNTYLDIPRHIAHLLGDKSTEDPNSWWYATTRQAQQIQDTVSENLGGIAGKAYLSFMNSASNLARGLTTAGAGGKVVQSIMGLGGFFLSVDQEATGRYLQDGYSYDQAQKMGAVDGMFEVAEEFLPFETMLGTEGAKFITSWVLNGLSEFGQEFTGGVLFDEIKATLTGQNDRNDRVNEIIVNGSYTDRDGNQVVLSDDPATAMQQARLQAGKEQFFNALEGGIGGFFGGGLAGFYGTANQAINDVYTGATINNENNVSDGKKAIESLIEVGKNTKDEGVQKLAEKVEGQYKGKGKAGDYLTGKLFRAVADATGVEGQETVKGTAWRFIRDDLTDKGVNREAAGEYADIVAKGLLGEKLTREDRQTLAKDQLAIDTWKRFNTKTADAAKIIEEVNEATREQRSVMDTLGEIAGTKPTAGGAMGAELEQSLQKTGGDMERALDDMFSRRSDLLSERYVGAVKESMADKTSPKNKSFLKDAMQIRAAAMTLGAMPKTSMDEATAKKLYDEARAEFDEIDQKRVLKQKTVEPGKGTASFGDAEYGTESWTQKMAGYSKRIRNQAGALAEVAKRAGLSLTFIDDARVDAKTGRDNAKINGFENQDGSIVINLAATEKFGKHMLTTMAHEMTHWLEQNSREGYDSMRQFVLGSLRSRGVNVEQLAVNTIDNQNAVLKGGDGLDFNGAMAEIVAKSCEELLSSRNFQQELAQTDPGTFDKVKTFVKDFVARINAALKDMANYYGSLSWEARQLRDYTEEIGNLWIGARREALGRNAEEGAEAGEGTRFSTAQETAAEERDAKRLKLETPEMLRYSMVGAAAGGSYAERIREAEALSRQGVDAEEIYQQTGAREGFNGKWWVTLDNQNIRMRDGIMEKHRSGKKFKLTDVMDAPELMKAYPALGDIKVQFKRMRAAYGAYHRDTNTIEVDLDTARTNPEMTAITLRHEIQHAIQRIEGVEGGASLYSWKEILDRIGSTEHPLNMYQRSVGEIEARAASKLEGPGMPTREQYANAVSMQEYARAFDEDIAMSDGTETHYGDHSRFSVRVTDPEELDFLNGQKTVTTYKTMQLIDGNLYPPMAAVVAGSKEDHSILGQWEKATEHPELIKKGNKFTLNKGKGKGSLDAAYNPYMHSSNLMINDQFSGAYDRPNLVTVECEVPESELTSGYHAEFAKDNVGWHSWHTGPVASEIRKQTGKERQVMLSRWIKPVRIVPDAEVAKHYKELMNGTDIQVPDNVVPPSLLKELKKAGIQIKESGKVKYSAGEETTDTESITHPQAAQFSVMQLAEANGMVFDEDTMTLYSPDHKVIDGVKNKITIDMIEKTPMGMLINLARDGSMTKGGKERFKPTISAETALAQKKMFTDLMNMIAQYKNSDLVWEIASSTLYSALKSNSDPQYSTTVDFGTICTKTQEIINVMSRVMLEKGRGLTREEVLKVYNETANAGLSVPCPVCYVFSRWMGVPSLLNQMSQYQKRFVVFEKDGKTINKRETEKKANAYIREALEKYGNKKALDAAKTSIINRMKTQETNKTDALLVISSRNATAEEKAAAQEKHDRAIKQLDELTKDLGEVEAYNWVTQALMKETRKGSGKYELDPEFRVTPDEILFDLRKTGEFAKDVKNWGYRNTRGAGMGKAIMPYSGMSIGDVIFGTERKSNIRNPFLHQRESTAANGIKNAIARARKQNLIGGQRLQSTSDFRPEWGLDYLMTFLELQAVGSKVQMYTKVAEAVDLLASMGADINLSIMGKGSGYHEATAAEIREAARNTKKGIDLRSRMQEMEDENGEMHTYVLDFSDITGMEYNTAKALKNKHDNVQMILVGMNDIHIRLAMANKDIDFIIPWHSSGNSRNTLERMIASVGEKLTTSSDYTDVQTDKAREDQTEEQKKLWDLRVKIIQGKEMTAEEMRTIQGDEYLSNLYDRFNVEGVDPDCYQVKLGKEQAEQIFPYEYWDKSLSKEEADGNGKRFVEYCRHFGITPRFESLSGYEGYWKLLIDRPMYDNNGNYRDQQVVDVTKARIGSLQGGKLKDSDMPLTTSAIYGSNYSEQEKTATDNSLAALDMQPDLQAVGTNVMEEEEDAPRNNMSTFGAVRNTPTLKTTETEQTEEIAQAKRRAVYADEEDGMRRAMSVQDETDMNVNHFMMGMQEGSLQTEQERTMLRQYKELHGALEVSRFALADYRKKLAKIEAMTNPSAYDRAEALKLRNLISNYVAKVDRLQEKLAQVTSSEGYAGMMYRQSRIMDDLVNGRSADEVTRTVSALNDRLRKVDAEIAKRQMQIDYLKSNLAGKKLETLVDAKSLDRMAGIIRKEYESTYNKSDLMHDMTAIRLKMAQGQKVDADVEELAWRILQQTKNGGGEDLQALRGITITLGTTQVKELLGSGSSMKELRSIFAGTGVTIRTAKAGEQGLDTDWQTLCDSIGNLDRDAKELNQVAELIRFVKSQKESMNPNKRYKDQIQGIAEEIQAMIATVSMNAPADPAAMQILQRMSGIVDEMAGGLEAGRQEMAAARKEIAGLVDEGRLAIRGAEDLQKTIETAIQYNNALSKQSEAARWKHDKAALVAQLKDENTKALLKEQAKWKERIERDRQARESMATNMHLRHQINTNVVRIRKLLLNETDIKNIPEHMKSLAREMLGMILENDITGGRKITGIQRKDIIDTVKALEEMKKADGEFTLDDLRMIEDEEAQAVVEDSLADIEDGITLYNGKPGNSLLDNLDDYRKALESIAEGVSNIVNVINAERYITQGDRQILVADAAQDVYKGMENSRFRGELRGRGSKAINAARSSVGYGNLTPVYFIKNLRNEGMTEQFNELQRGENRSGLEYKKAQDFVGAIAEKTHYKDWAGKKITVRIGSRQVEMTIDNAMEILAIWNREQLETAEAPDKSNHMTRGGIYIRQEEDNKGAIRREKEQQRPMRLTESDIGGIREALTDEQKEYMDKVVGFLSNEMSQLGNEASMRMYGIKKYKEDYYFPMKIWDGVKSARSDKGIAGTDENRAAHKSWSKRRINRANNALVIGNFTEDAVNHIVEMINYNTMAPAIENLNKVLNFKLSEIAEDGEESKRNVRIAFQEAYGKEALNYLETFLKDLNGGAVQDQRKTLRDRMLSVFKKNAVAGSLSVTLQQPLSYIRAAMMLNPMDLARALNPTYWKGSWAEMQKYSGVAVIKDMGRFDMNFGQSAKDFIAPEKKGSAYQKISDILTAAPEMADRMTWTRMWSACKIEQHRLHPEMDITSDEFLQQVAERFNDVMRKTQVYDSVLVKSSNMRSNNLSMKILTSFMAEPTLSLNVLADAARNIRDKGGKALAAKAAATFLISAALQAAVKGLMGSGRTPDDKKTWEENFLYKYIQAFLSEANPISLIPGYGDLIELLKNGELSDDAMSVIGKFKSILETSRDALSGKGKGWYRDLEDTAGQMAQLFTNIPAKNILRDLRAAATWFGGSELVGAKEYAKRPTSGAVIRYQTESATMTADNMLGVINSLMGDAGFQTKNSAYYQRLFDAMQRGNQAEADSIREYLTLGKGIKDTSIDSGLKDIAKQSMEAADADDWMIEQGMMDGTGTITKQLKAGEITFDEAGRLMKKADPKLTDNDVWWRLDRIRYQQEKKLDEAPGGNYYRLTDAINANKAEEIRKAVKDLMAHGITKEQIIKKIGDWKTPYKTADTAAERRVIRDALQKTYKAMGLTAADADAKIDSWYPESNKNKKTTKKKKN